VEERRKKISCWNGIVGSCCVDREGAPVPRTIDGGSRSFLSMMFSVVYVQFRGFVRVPQVDGVIWACDMLVIARRQQDFVKTSGR
jgi:hypothetical protein